MVKISNHLSEFMLYPFNQFLVFFYNADSTRDIKKIKKKLRKKFASVPSIFAGCNRKDKFFTPNVDAADDERMVGGSTSSAGDQED